MTWDQYWEQVAEAKARAQHALADGVDREFVEVMYRAELDAISRGEEA